MKKLISLILAMMLLLTALPVCAEDESIFDPTITVAVLGDKTVSELYEDDIWAAMASILLLIDYISSPVGAQDQLDNYSLTDVFVGIDTLDDGTLIFNALFPSVSEERILGIMMIPDPGVANYTPYSLEGISATLYGTFIDTLLTDVCDAHKQVPADAMNTSIQIVLDALEE